MIRRIPPSAVIGAVYTFEDREVTVLAEAGGRVLLQWRGGDIAPVAAGAFRRASRRVQQRTSSLSKHMQIRRRPRKQNGGPK